MFIFIIVRQSVHTIMHANSTAKLHYFIKLCKRLRKKKFFFAFYYVLQHKSHDIACAYTKKVVPLRVVL